MIIVEGPDGSGKTTLIKQLGLEPKRLRALRGGEGGTLVDGSCGTTSAGWGGQDEAPIAYARQLLGAGERTAFDRFHVSEQVYGPLLRGASGITDEEATVLRRLLNARGIPVVVCLPPFRVMLNNVLTAGRERPAFQTIPFLGQAYNNFKMRTHHEGYWKYDYTRYVELPRLLHRPTCPPGVVGSPAARFLLVGERSNLPLDLPFFSMQGSSGFLNRALWEAGFAEPELAFTNAYAADGAPRDLRAVLLASTAAVVALGVEAAMALGEQQVDEVPILTVAHPQFWQRFRARDRDGYVARLREIRRTINGERR